MLLWNTPIYGLLNKTIFSLQHTSSTTDETGYIKTVQSKTGALRLGGGAGGEGEGPVIGGGRRGRGRAYHLTPVSLLGSDHLACRMTPSLVPLQALPSAVLHPSAIRQQNDTL